MAVMRSPKYQEVFEKLRAEIIGNVYPPGKRLPSEAELGKRFNASRITVGRAMQELRQAGMIERRAGSGTFARSGKPGSLSFGLLIPNMGQSEIFQPICQGMTDSPQARGHSLLWGSLGASDQPAEPAKIWELTRQYIEQKVAGVFFAPLEFRPHGESINTRVSEALTAARIPVVLLDRDLLPYPARSAHDLVGIDNRRAGYLVTEHLLGLGCKRVAFVAYPHAAATVGARIAGYQEALIARGMRLESASSVWEIIPTDQKAVAAFIDDAAPQGIVCANDRTAGELMHTLLQLGRRLPKDVKIAGIDDVDYAGLLPVPLTTVRQPCREIGMAAMSAMLERIGRPTMPTRDILLACQLVTRASSAPE